MKTQLKIRKCRGSLYATLLALLLIPGNALLMSCSEMFADDELTIDGTIDTIGSLNPKYKIVDTGTTQFYGNLNTIAAPSEGQPFYGQDASYSGNQPSYLDNCDGTISDLVTGLMWTKAIDGKQTYEEAKAGAASCSVGGYGDWRLPTIKELYSLILFSGTDPSGPSSPSSIPFLDSQYFDFEFGDESKGERIIDAQYWSATEYVSTTMNGQATVFGVNFADGRIKGYPRNHGPQGDAMTEFVRYVRSNPYYGVNSFRDNGDGTVTDLATGLIWMTADSGVLKAGRKGDGTMNWEEALSWAESLDYAGFNDWRLPDAKELQSLVDYTRSPATTQSAAIDPLFTCTPIVNEKGESDFGFYWTGTTHVAANGSAGSAAYVAFGEASGFLEMPPLSGNYLFTDVHGAGAQRSDPKTGDPGDYPYGHGPQGDVIRIYNLVRCVRNAK